MKWNTPRVRKLVLAGSMFAMAALAGLTGCSNDDDPPIAALTTPATPTLTQIDRMAIPVVATVFIPRTPVDERQNFNRGDPATDVAQFRALAIGRLTQIRAAVNAVAGFPPENSPGLSVAQVIDIVIPDVFTIDFSRPLNFPNGRALADDVIDVELGLTLNRGNPLGGGPGVSDGVANDSTFSGTFPYMGAAN